MNRDEPALWERWRYRWWGITSKTMLSYVLLAIFVTGLSGVMAYQLGYQYMRETSLSELLERAQYIASREPQKYRRIDPPDKEMLGIYQSLTDSSVFFVNADYYAVHTQGGVSDDPDDESNVVRTQISDVLDQHYITRILMGETVLELRWFEFAKGEALFAGIPLVNIYDETIGALVLIQPLETFAGLWRMLRNLFLISAVAALLMAVFLAWKLSEALVRPIAQITHIAGRIAAGDYRQRVYLRQADEIGELGKAVNALSAQLGEVIEGLKKERDQLETILSSIEEGIIAIDNAGGIVRVNRAFLELMEVNQMDEIDEDSPGEIGMIAALLKECMFARRKQKRMWINPSKRNVSAIISPLFGERREIVGAVAVLQDVSEYERLEQLRRDYVANISHELRTPLTGIRGMVEPLMDGYIETEDEQAECYRIIHRETLRLEKLIAEMLDVSRLQDGRARLETDEMEVHGVVAESVLRMSATAQQAMVQLKTEMPDEELLCQGNEDRVLQVLTILIDNALSFTPQGGSVTVYARNERDAVRMGVIDTGVGIESKHLPFIWERFYKSDTSRMRTSGTGLGLAIAKLVVNLMGGEIDVRTEIGTGSEFFFTLKK